jgi:hypothetical protein
VRLGGEVHDHVDPLIAKCLLDQLEVADVALHEDDPILEVAKALAVARVGKQVVRDDMVVRVALQAVADEVGADEPGGAGNEQPHRRAVYAGRNRAGSRRIFCKGDVDVPAGALPSRLSGRGCPRAMDFTRLAATFLAALGLAGSAPTGHAYRDAKQPASLKAHRSQPAIAVFVAATAGARRISLAQYGAYGYALRARATTRSSRTTTQD